MTPQIGCRKSSQKTVHNHEPSWGWKSSKAIFVSKGASASKISSKPMSWLQISITCTSIRETWLDNSVSSNKVRPLGFSVFRTNQEPTITRKTRGSGVCLLMSGVIRWWWERACVPLTLNCHASLSSPSTCPGSSFRYFSLLYIYIHRQILTGHLLLISWYLFHKLESLSPDAPKFILWDSNNCPGKKCLSAYYQYVDCPSRKKKKAVRFMLWNCRRHLLFIIAPISGGIWPKCCLSLACISKVPAEGQAPRTLS